MPKLGLKNKRIKKQKVEPKTTGHEWDGIKEYNNPDPKWLRVVFYITILYSLGYWLLYPSWPSPNNVGILGWTSYKELREELKELEELRSQYQAEFDKSSFAEIKQNKQLMKFALRGGESAFNINCAGCHQIGGGGARGFPNLTDDNWIWGGTIEDIYTTLLYGIRSDHFDARDSQMAAFGRDGILTETEVALVAKYAAGLYSGKSYSAEGIDIYTEHCASCHGANGEGDREFGAPRLNSPIWLYGGEYETIYDVIYSGRGGVMPYWSSILPDSTIRQLALYVHSLGGGEKSYDVDNYEDNAE